MKYGQYMPNMLWLVVVETSWPSHTATRKGKKGLGPFNRSFKKL